MKKNIFILGLISVMILITGCARYSQVGSTIGGDKVIISKKDIHARTQMSETFFLEPVVPSKQIVYIKVRNTSDENMNITSKLKLALMDNGFMVTKDPTQANFIIQANILKAGMMDENEQKSYLVAGFSSGLLVAGITNLTGGDNSKAGKVAVAGALIGMLDKALKVENVYYGMITDIEIRQRPLSGENVIQNEKISHSTINQKSTITHTKWKRYRTRIISSAYARGLNFSQAKPFLEDGMIKALVGTM